MPIWLLLIILSLITFVNMALPDNTDYWRKEVLYWQKEARRNWDLYISAFAERNRCQDATQALLDTLSPQCACDDPALEAWEAILFATEQAPPR